MPVPKRPVEVAHNRPLHIDHHPSSKPLRKETLLRTVRPSSCTCHVMHVRLSRRRVDCLLIFGQLLSHLLPHLNSDYRYKGISATQFPPVRPTWTTHLRGMPRASRLSSQTSPVTSPSSSFSAAALLLDQAAYQSQLSDEKQWGHVCLVAGGAQAQGPSLSWALESDPIQECIRRLPSRHYSMIMITEKRHPRQINPGYLNPIPPSGMCLGQLVLSVQYVL